MSNELVDLFHHRWAAPALHLLDERGGARFVELQRRLDVGRDSLRRGIDSLIQLGYAQRDTGYGDPLRPEYVITRRGRRVAPLAARIVESSESETLLRKWSVPILAALDEPRRFSELRAALPAVTARALALALRDLERTRLVRREVLPTRPPSTVYRATAKAVRVLHGREDDFRARSGT